MQKPSAHACPHCRQSFTALQQRSAAAHCGAAPCRHAHAMALQAAQRAAALQQRREEAPAPWRAAVAQATVIWLRPFRPVLVAVDADTRARFVAHLQDVAEHPSAHPRNPALDHPERPHAQAHAADAPLCTMCGGRCCQAGLANHAFLDAPVLARWADRAPGRTLADAAAHYAAQVPSHHIDGGCVYQGERGCVLSREDRAPLCNAYACESLKATREALDDGGGAFIAEPQSGEVTRAGWLPRGASAVSAWGPQAAPADRH